MEDVGVFENALALLASLSSAAVVGRLSAAEREQLVGRLRETAALLERNALSVSPEIPSTDVPPCLSTPLEAKKHIFTCSDSGRASCQASEPMQEDLRGSMPGKRCAETSAETSSLPCARADGQWSTLSSAAAESAEKPPGKKKRAKAGKGEPHLLDLSFFKQRHIALKIAYLGWNYDGFALQRDTKETVEEYLFAALRKAKLVGENAEAERWSEGMYSRCGRTDKGVSALGQVVSLLVRSNALASSSEDKLPSDQKEIDYVGVLNRQLPEDIRVLAWAPVAEDFSARFSCTWRHYKYFFELEEGMDGGKMRDAARALLGEHDFRNYCKMDAVKVHSYTRGLLQFSLSRVSGGVADAGRMHVADIRGTAFLYHQVRCMMAVLLMVGKGQEPLEILGELADLAEFPRKPQYHLASEEPLVLYACGYPDEPKWRCSQGSMRTVQQHFEDVLKRQRLRAAVVCQAAICAGVLPVNSSEGSDAVPSVDSSEEHAVLSEQQPGGASLFSFNDERQWQKREKHIPLRRRPTEQTYEEKRKRIVAKSSEGSNAHAIKSESEGIS
ncbi:hypothetical protein CYMTET_56994 [Cymbomonas tetramitiformis]|uniref:Pseudouridine synthase I TruA alpha/beta domain-containing protein n=1 Tax=Cymbomonas tetramitiformis TaxID=36881 RepID=A0AAE0BB05_9CHLO|nr:hypothetical protein CYMTET_56994 [Cymbomonas tetramitiformis]